MAIKQGTQDHITACLSGGIDSWQVFGIYEYGWACQSCLCGHKIATCFVLIRKGDHGPAFGESVQLGSECIKFVQKSNPDLYKWLMTAKAEMDRTKRQMKKQREDEFHASPEWKALSTRMEAIMDIIRAARPAGNGVRDILAPIGVTLDPHTRWAAKDVYTRYQKSPRFEDVEKATYYVESIEKLAAKIIAEATPFKAEIDAKLAKLRLYLPGYSELRAIAERIV
jgi:hypothetical protein